MLTTVYFLRWQDMAPALRDFDPEPARRLVAPLVHAVAARFADTWRDTPHDDRDALESAIHRALLEEYGAWAAGWRWAAGEAGCGGPVRGWSYSRESLFRDDDPDPDATVTRAVAALSEWRQFLVDLDVLFAELRDTTATLPLEDRVERAAARLLPLIVDRTSAEAAWYNTFARILLWYLETLGHDHPAVGRAVLRVIGRHFAPWCPDEATARDACAALGLDVARDSRWASAQPRPDALATWLSTRSTAFLHFSIDEPPRVRVRRDGHLHFVEQRDRPRDPVRADRMLAALAACRASARRDEPLTFAALAAWQSLVLGGDVPRFRTTDAFANAGHARYGIAPDTFDRFAACLAESEPGREPPALRAARVYRDICFFHPFPDGNARAARLALDHVITRAGLALHAAEPLFVIARDARDARGAWCFARALDRLLGLPPERS
jgi:hypothetical protein